MQYGGSHLVNTMATYRKLNHWQSHSRDMVESFKRYYHNSFLDTQRQEAYNLFLGNYTYVKGQPMLWDLATDYYLHHSDPRGYLDRARRDYYMWYTPEFLRPRELPPVRYPADHQFTEKVYDYDDYWIEYYRPEALSSFLKMYIFRMNNTSRYLPDRPHNRDKAFDFSPFKPRLEPQRQQTIESPDKRAPRKGVTILDPSHYEEREARARERLTEAGQTDWPLLAASLALDAPIWSNDKHLWGTGVAVWRTRTMRYWGEGSVQMPLSYRGPTC